MHSLCVYMCVYACIPLGKTKDGSNGAMEVVKGLTDSQIARQKWCRHCKGDGSNHHHSAKQAFVELALHLVLKYVSPLAVPIPPKLPTTPNIQEQCCCGTTKLFIVNLYGAYGRGFDWGKGLESASLEWWSIVRHSHTTSTCLEQFSTITQRYCSHCSMVWSLPTSPSCGIAIPLPSGRALPELGPAPWTIAFASAFAERLRSKDRTAEALDTKKAATRQWVHDITECV